LAFTIVKGDLTSRGATGWNRILKQPSGVERLVEKVPTTSIRSTGIRKDSIIPTEVHRWRASLFGRRNDRRRRIPTSSSVVLHLLIFFSNILLNGVRNRFRLGLYLLLAYVGKLSVSLWGSTERYCVKIMHQAETCPQV
jgi:hypothetical protein